MPHVEKMRMTATQVALHPEGVDRNACDRRSSLERRVALHPEGVDRNLEMIGFDQADIRSPSTRRAWIEIF